jgi:hypothetical protein
VEKISIPPQKSRPGIVRFRESRTLLLLTAFSATAWWKKGGRNFRISQADTEGDYRLDFYIKVDEPQFSWERWYAVDAV